MSTLRHLSWVVCGRVGFEHVPLALGVTTCVFSHLLYQWAGLPMRRVSVGMWLAAVQPLSTLFSNLVFCLFDSCDFRSAVRSSQIFGKCEPLGRFLWSSVKSRLAAWGDSWMRAKRKERPCIEMWVPWRISVLFSSSALHFFFLCSSMSGKDLAKYVLFHDCSGQSAFVSVLHIYFHLPWQQPGGMFYRYKHRGLGWLAWRWICVCIFVCWCVHVCIYAYRGQRVMTVVFFDLHLFL